MFEVFKYSSLFPSIHDNARSEDRGGTSAQQHQVELRNRKVTKIPMHSHLCCCWSAWPRNGRFGLPGQSLATVLTEKPSRSSSLLPSPPPQIVNQATMRVRGLALLPDPITPQARPQGPTTSKPQALKKESGDLATTQRLSCSYVITMTVIKHLKM